MRLIVIPVLMLSIQAFAAPKDASLIADKSGANTQQTTITAVKKGSTFTFYNGKKRLGSWSFVEGEIGSWDKSKAKISGLVTIFNEKNNIIGKGQYVDNMKQGKWLEYSATGKLHGEYVYKKGNRNGPYKIYFQSGSVAEEGIYLSGDDIVYEKGNYKTYYPSGKVESICTGARSNGEGSEMQDCSTDYSNSEKHEERVYPDYTP